jgi:hypothetical protein
MRAALVASKDGSGLVLDDENGKHRVGLTAFNDGPALDLFDRDGKIVFKAP